MKIVHLLSQVELTGAEVYAIDLTDELIKRNHTCYIVSDKIHKRTKATFIPLTIHNATFFRRLRSILFLRQFLKSNEIQIIHAHSRAAVRIGFWATRFSKCALISTLHGKQHFSYSKRIFNIYGENILSVCENVKLHFTRNFKFHESQAQISRNFLNTHVIDHLLSQSTSKNESAAGERNSQEYDAKPKVVSFLGRTSGPKGLNWECILQKYLETWIQKFPQVLFQFGGGEITYFSEATQQKIKRLSLAYPNQFKFLGKRDHLFQVISESDVVLGSGRIAIESLYLEKTVLAIGEEIYLGPITTETFPTALNSNFGDIDCEIKYHVDFEKLASDLETILSQPCPPPTIRSHLKSMTMARFDKNFEVTQMIEHYLWAQFKRRHPKNIPILMYHQLVEPSYTSPHKVYITEARFEEHLSYLKSAGFTAITFKDLIEFKNDLSASRQFPKRPVIITFDDGYENNWLKAVPLLQKYNMRAIFYLLANIHESNFWDADSNSTPLKLMSPEQRMQLSQVMEIGSHGFNHQKLSTMSEEPAFDELLQSKDSLEKELGLPVLSYAYTYGDRSDRDIYLAKKSAYSFAVNTTRGVLHLADNPHNLFRVSIFPTDTAADLRRKTRTWYRRYYLKKRNE